MVIAIEVHEQMGFGCVRLRQISDASGVSLRSFVQDVVSLLKRWLLGTQQGTVSREHLDYYLDQYTFRFNRRMSKARGLLFHRLMEQAVRTDPAPYARLVQGADRGITPGGTAGT